MILLLTLLVLVDGASPAVAWDWRGGSYNDADTCFTNAPEWSAAFRRVEFGEAVVDWEVQVPGISIDHNPNVGQCSITFDVEIDWIDCAPDPEVQFQCAPASTVTPGTSGEGGALAVQFSRYEICIPVDPPQEKAVCDAFQSTQWDWSYDNSLSEGEIDFRGVAVHELGHVLGLHHPEMVGVYQWESFDWVRPVMVSSVPAELTIDQRFLAQDDISGGRYIAARDMIPNSSLESLFHWEPMAGSVTDCGSYVCLGVGAAMRTEVRRTLGQDFSHYIAALRWRVGALPATDGVSIRLTRYAVDIFGTRGSPGSTTHYCQLASTNWQSCSFSQALNTTSPVIDVVVRVENTSNRIVHVDDVTLSCSFPAACV